MPDVTTKVGVLNISGTPISPLVQDERVKITDDGVDFASITDVGGVKCLDVNVRAGGGETVKTIFMMSKTNVLNNAWTLLTIPANTKSFVLSAQGNNVAFQLSHVSLGTDYEDFPAGSKICEDDLLIGGTGVSVYIKQVSGGAVDFILRYWT